MTGAGAGGPVRRPGPPPPVLSYAQERMWLEWMLRPGDSAYHLPLRLELTGPLRPAALRGALDVVIRRHDVLRTRYGSRRGRPVAIVDDPMPPRLPLIDLCGLPADVGTAMVDAIAAAEAARPFDLSTGPVLRVLLVRLDADRHILLITRHHVASDGWSLGILLSELGAGYRAGDAGRPAGLAPLPLRYADYAAWQREPGGPALDEAALSRWTSRLDGATFGLDLLADPPPSAGSGPARSIRCRLPATLAATLAETARTLGTTTFVVLLGAYAWALYGAGGQADLVIGTAVAGRTWVALEPLIGAFATMVPLRLDLAGAPTFAVLVRRTHATVRAALADQDVPPERIVEELQPHRTLGDHPLFAVAFTLQNTPPVAIELPGVHGEARPDAAVMPKFALALTATPHDDGLDLVFEYDPHRLTDQLAARIAGNTYAALVSGCAAPDRVAPTTPDGTADATGLVHLDARPGGGRSADVHPPTATRCLPDLVADAVARQPDAIAVTWHGNHLTYRELERRSARLARHLRARRVGPETLVGICLDRSPDLVVAALAVARAGGAYLPIDPADPARRQETVCAAAGLRLAISRQGLLCAPVDQLLLDDLPPDPEHPGPPGGPRVTPANALYAISTSGSTGEPKTVVVTHANLAAVIDAVRAAALPPGGPRVWSMTHAPAFDVSVFEMWAALTEGGRLVVVPPDVARAPDELCRHLRAEQVAVLSQTPSAFAQLAPFVLRDGTPGSLRAVLLAGEACDVAALDGWFTAFGDRRPVLTNLYGITETTVHAMVRPLTAGDAGAARSGTGPGSPIGRALPGLLVRVHNPRGDELPEGGKGEIVVGGSGVTRGYLGRPGLTAYRFRPLADGGRGYRSGDVARVLPGGELAYQGRGDHQLKLRGHRIEPGEIESALSAQPGVRSAAVVLGSTRDRPHLVGYVVAGAGTSVEENAVRRRLAERLPRYMVPARIVVVDELPASRNGKVDRAELTRRSGSLPDPIGRDRPRTPTEATLATILAELLGFESAAAIGVTDNLFDLGGDSLVVTRFHARIVEVFRVDAPVRRVYQALDIASLAATVDEWVAERGRQAIRDALAEVTGMTGEDGWQQ
ncbi:amino acid adenylation domain-containing protein [Micromonospora haikouensis]|uniref:Amino acid adenylation domain-containing protein n=1 Tax=Micromonospora haikouensis TaxID=686309 RepID=A0A1C4XHR4_9ACTN|nr:non-ribosomal peptide synthetase [Micromonospora haikouensis]SCF07721.1 amino acid adenylation domain-containing protein [Micromonospora haikouensis]